MFPCQMQILRYSPLFLRIHPTQTFANACTWCHKYSKMVLCAAFPAVFYTVSPWLPIVTGFPGLHDNAASADACR